MFHPQGPTLRELAVEALSSTQQGYDLLAPKFDHTPFRTPDLVLEAVARRLATAAPYGKGLDLCCGTGAGMKMLRPLCTELVVGVDFSRGMLEAGRRAVDWPGEAAVEWVRADVLDLPVSRTFDVAVCFGACGHFLDAEQPRFIGEAHRALRPGGRLVLVSSYMPPVWSRRYWLSRTFNGAMRVRNLLISPPFVMYYLTFLLPGLELELGCQGFEVEVQPLAITGPLADLHLVIATVHS